MSVALVAGAMLAFTSCSNDDDEQKTNKFTIDGVDYKLIGATLDNYGSDEDNFLGYNTDLHLHGEDASIYFEAFSTIGTALDKRTYQYSSNPPFAIGTFSPASGWGNETSSFDFTKGSFTVKAVSGDQYEIEFSCEDEDGDIVTGYYKGTVKLIVPQQ